MLPLLSVLVLAAPLSPHDGWIGNAGAPKLMAGHPSVRMVSEIVKVTIRKQDAEVDCTFTFKNGGPASSVRMGLYGESQLRALQSFVDGKPAKTSYVASDDRQGWRVKTVAFAKSQVRRVTERYKMPLGTFPITGPGAPALYHAQHLIYPSASWKGPVGRTEIVVTFAADAPIAKGDIKPIVQMHPSQRRAEFWKPRMSQVLIQGPSAALVKGRTIKFVRKNWESTRGDDVNLLFGLHNRRK